MRILIGTVLIGLIACGGGVAFTDATGPTLGRPGKPPAAAGPDAGTSDPLGQPPPTGTDGGVHAPAPDGGNPAPAPDAGPAPAPPPAPPVLAPIVPPDSPRNSPHDPHPVDPRPVP